jgi:hypothetical protein
MIDENRPPGNVRPESDRRPDEVPGPRRSLPGLPFQLHPAMIGIGLFLLLVAGVAIVIGYQRMAELRQIEAEDRAAMAAYLQSIGEPLAQLSPLTNAERLALRRTNNQMHVEQARELGVPPVDNREDVIREAEAAGLVEITHTPFYRVRDLTYSVPYVTEDTAALLDTIGVRFHRRLAEVGLPPFEYTITSVLRTREDQRRLARVNVNAARGTSSHEFGTTFDIQFRQYRLAGSLPAGAPEPRLPALRDEFEREVRRAYNELAEENYQLIKSLLGKVLIELQNEGLAMVILERQQPVFHVTVAEPLAEG